MYIENKSRQVALIISASLAGFMALLDGNIVNISLPYIASYFNVSTANVVQIILAYLVVLVGTMIIFGKLADQYGVKKVFISGFVIFTLSSLLCGFATSLPLLLLFRVIQATGASMLFATAVSLLPRFIPKDKLGWAFGIFSPITSLGLLVGNPLGGLITGLLDWHWIFLINVPIGIVAVALALKAIPNDQVGTTTKIPAGNFDFLGSMLSFFGLAILVFCLNQGRSIGWTNPLIFGGIVSSVILILLFIQVEKRAANPILDLNIFHTRDYSLCLISSFSGYGLMAGSSILMPFYLTYVLKINVEHAGFILMTFAVIFSAISPMAGNLSDRFMKNRLSASGMLLAIAACIFFILLMPLAKLWVVFILLATLGFSYAFFITPNNNLVMSLADPKKQTISASIYKLSTNMGQMTGILLMEMMFTIPMPKGFHADGSKLKSMDLTAFISGFQWAYAGGILMCLVSLSFLLMVKEEKNQDDTPEGAIALL